MANQSKTVKPVQNITLGVHDGHRRSAEKNARVAALALEHHQQRSVKTLLKNEMLAIRYSMEEYVIDENITAENIRTVKDFVTTFLTTLGIKKGQFAGHIEIDNSNLNKYFTNERPFNPELALKFGYFFHTAPDLWLKIHFKNELLLLNVNKKSEESYKKYDYEKLLQTM